MCVDLAAAAAAAAAAALLLNFSSKLTHQISLAPTSIREKITSDK